MIYHRVLHIRGTPASGKTILRLLLERYIELKEPEWLVSSAGVWPTELNTDLDGTTRFIENPLNPPKTELFSVQDRALLVDEPKPATGTYTFGILS